MSDEFEIIAKYFAPLSQSAPGARNLMDDAAVIAPPDGSVHVVTTDTVVEGVHYLSGAPAEDAAAKAMGSNLSDLAAMGAEPVGITLSCAWGKSTDETYIAQFAAALSDWCSGFACPLLGGDTVRTGGPTVLTITAIGMTPAGAELTRDGALPGDGIYVSGTIGDGALGLFAAQGTFEGADAAALAFLQDRYRMPQPRIGLGVALRGHASACIDVSDGLLQDAGHIARTSNVRLAIDSQLVPLSHAAKTLIDAKPELTLKALTGGDDYELLFTASEGLKVGNDVPVTRIGRVIERGEAPAAAVLLDDTGTEITVPGAGYRHFD